MALACVLISDGQEFSLCSGVSDTLSPLDLPADARNSTSRANDTKIFCVTYYKNMIGFRSYGQRLLFAA
jgi:hypothetical protein